MYRRSAWDYPSFLMTFLPHVLPHVTYDAIDLAINEDHIRMHPTVDDLNAWQTIDPDFTTHDLNFDT